MLLVNLFTSAFGSRRNIKINKNLFNIASNLA
uniref:Uncharacterized protein n=1 Tax=Rhizophora mucronata TaxID=61149 RepID=A0A2P2NXS6_RHIMU